MCVLIMNGDGGHRNEILSIVSNTPSFITLSMNVPLMHSHAALPYE